MMKIIRMYHLLLLRNYSNKSTLHGYFWVELHIELTELKVLRSEVGAVVNKFLLHVNGIYTYD